ncbi:MAG: methylenetetrahydrofolate reductase [NAD(P)H] [Betaproteobacteria bacterium]|nr:methylenetetrahydrofolate reductase [NAD(P)H] [Betaproteobacteria bacterium]
MSSTTRIPVSLEFFPPKTAQAAASLPLTRQALYPLRPAFCSVTYGAGGTTQAGTFATVADILTEGCEAAAHFTCINATRASVRAQLQQLRTMGVRRLVALRGDLPAGYAGGDFRYAADLVGFIREEAGSHFRIDVAAYPEVHPQAASARDDVTAFVAKVRAGADGALTQYFYNADGYFRFVDEVRALGVDVPIVPGILPITNAAQLIRFSDACGADIPRWLRMRLQSLGDDIAGAKAFGLDVVTDLCERLLAGGAPGFHFYTMNQGAPTLALCERLGLLQTGPQALAA